ncbi:hypothetical protein [Roseivivax sp. THAF197b]|uniref:hypothetical protein n=1 Tax=Roseivivax sp. THAF197b TaxID=2588299 RepID=UPI001269127E|nr:hypothetical protein [Roseivivax sp. THAF197b]QFS83676.1 hypothetical protein FIV09_12635 [Roseivivax sp. THAF197b]
MKHADLTPRQRRIMASVAEKLTKAPERATCADSARHCAYIERLAYHDPAEVDRVTAELVGEARRIECWSNADVLFLRFASLAEACRDRHLAEIAALGAGFWPREVSNKMIWANRESLLGRRYTLSFAGQRWWGEVFAPDDTLDD